jgi:heme-degrading monooxygenase HmoA
MIIEIAQLQVKPGQTAAFERDFAVASTYIRRIDGYLAHELQRCLEDDHRYLVVVHWTTVEAHLEGFRQSPEFLEWKRLLHRYYELSPTIEHFARVEIERTAEAGRR